MIADLNLMRQIALAVENSSTTGLPEIAGRSPDEVGYHAHLLIDKGLAEGFSVRSVRDSHPYDLITSLTMAGHEFAELARDEGRWQAAITEAQDGGPVTLAILQDLLTRPRRHQSVPAPNPGNAASQTSRDAGTIEKGNLAILRGTDGKLKNAVTLDTARRFGGVTKRSIERAAEKGSLESQGSLANRRIIVASLLKYFPPENSAT